MDALSASDRLLLESTKMIREDFLHQNAFEDIDTYTSLEKQFYMLDSILYFFEQGKAALERGVDIDQIVELDVRDDIGRTKMIPEDEMDKLKALNDKIPGAFAELIKHEEEGE